MWRGRRQWGRRRRGLEGEGMDGSQGMRIMQDRNSGHSRVPFMFKSFKGSNTKRKAEVGPGGLCLQTGTAELIQCSNR
eukprot:1159832-Pelagomonas_calceolata.AAC.6